MIDRYPRRRFRGFAVAVSLGLAALVGRLAVLQIGEHRVWQQHGVRLSSAEREVTPRRGALLDRQSYPLAITDLRAKVGVTDPKAWLDPRKLAELSAALHLSQEQLRAKLEGHDGHTYVSREAALSPIAIDSLRRVQGLSLELVQHRTYPMGRLAGQVLGRVNQGGRGDAGVELMCDAVLAGKPGRELARFDGGYGRPLIKTTLLPPVNGTDVVLTLDYRVQMILEEELELALAESGAEQALGIVLEPWTGEILAMASAPGLPDRDERPLPGFQWRNPAAEDAFEPGSTFKMFTYASLLSRALCDTGQFFNGERDPVTGKGVADFGGFRIHDVHPVGVISVRHAFEVSSNIIAAKAAILLRPEDFHADLKRFGLGVRTGSGLPGESNGLLTPLRQWSKRSLPTLAIGQEISLTMLQLAAGYAALITDGTLRTPRLIAAFVDEQGRPRPLPTAVVRERIVSPEVIATLRALCHGVVEDDYGTGHTARVEGLSIGGKTGTAQMSGPHGYLDGAYTASFVGFTPVDDPRMLCAIVVHRPRVPLRWGGTTAAPCYARVISKVFASTEWLDAEGVPPAEPSRPQPAPAVAERIVPDLRGHSAPEVLALAQAQGLRVEPLPQGSMLRAISQLPRPGARLAQGALVQVAWRREGQP